VTVDAFVAVYRTGLPGIPRNAVLPIAAPVHEGAATAWRAVAAVEVTLRRKLKVEPSFRAKVKLWPDAERAVVSLYELKSNQQKLGQLAGAVPPLVAGAQVADSAGVTQAKPAMQRIAQAAVRQRVTRDVADLALDWCEWTRESFLTRDGQSELISGCTTVLPPARHARNRAMISIEYSASIKPIS